MDVENIKVGPVDVSLLAKDDRIVSHIRQGNGFEPQSLSAWAEMCRAGGVVLDIGCYSGLFAIAAAKLGCTVRAFEPMPRNIERIRKNGALNGVNFDLMQCVVSDHEGTATLTFNPNVVGLTAGASLIRKTGNKAIVPSITIDGLELNGVVAVKIDVERAEPMVMRGARKTLTRCRPQMLVEALGTSERAAVESAAQDYRVQDVLDLRNLLMAPC